MRTLLLAIITVVMTAAPSFSQIAVIANKNVDLAVTEIKTVTDLYTFEIQKDKNGIPIVLFDMKSGPRDTFYSAMNKTSTELKKIWMKMQLSGDGKAPAALENEDEVLAKVAATPGGIGYVSSAKATDAVKTLFLIK